jgi:hypothetical protein
MAVRQLITAAIALIAVQAWATPARVFASAPGCDVASAPAAAGAVRPTFSVGFVGARVWTIAQYGALQIRKEIAKGGSATTELRHGTDVVALSTSKEQVTVTRGGRTVVLSADSVEPLQALLAGSSAVFATREMLSALEDSTTFRAQDMFILSTAAFVASLTGDTHAPLRLSDRFVARHRGLFRIVSAPADDGDASCWTSYTNETSSAWNDLQACMAETADDGWLVGAAMRIGCNAIWLMRSESAWFEYLKCLSPTSIAKLE